MNVALEYLLGIQKPLVSSVFASRAIPRPTVVLRQIDAMDDLRDCGSLTPAMVLNYLSRVVNGFLCRGSSDSDLRGELR